MKLFELTGIKKYKDLSVNQIMDFLKYRMGRGANSNVFLINNEVYKFWLKDSGYEKFIEYVENNPSNPHLPKLKSPIKTLTVFFKKTPNFPDKIKYIKLEKLEPCSTSLYFPDTKMPVHRTIQVITKSLNEETMLNNLQILAKHENYVLSADFIKQAIELRKLVLKLSADRSHLHMLDLDNINNWMNRGNVLVITDPYACSNSIRFNEILKMEMLTA